MNVKTLTGPSIHAALVEARRLLGDDVVLLESIPAQGDTPARITVMSDTSAPALGESAPAAAQATAQAAADEVATRGSRYGYGATSSRTTTGAADTLLTDQPANGTAGRYALKAPPAPGGTPRPASWSGNGDDARIQPRTPGRNRLYARPDETTDPGGALVSSRLESILEAQLQVLHERLDRIDRRFESAIIGAGQRWTSYAIFARLLRQGMRPQTVGRLFEGLIARGYAPDADEQTIQWAVAQEIRNALQAGTPKLSTGTQVFIGPSGSGKTSLILKLTTHPSFFARRNPTVIALLPDDERVYPYHNPADFFRRFGVPVQAVRTAEEMEQALGRVTHFDQILIDTPPMPVHEVGARKMLMHVKRLVDPLVPFQVHLVLNATRALEDFEVAYVGRLPLRPDLVALTHLDETRSWGRVTEWMIDMKLPVQFASTSPRIPDGVGAFSPTWFIEEMMKLA